MEHEFSVWIPDRASKPLAQVGRLAMREDGTEWKAYYAEVDTMEGALFLGSIPLACIRNSPHGAERKQAYFNLMQACVGDLLEQQTGTRPTFRSEMVAR